MYTLRDRRTGDLFDRWSDLGEKRRLLLERSWAGVFREHLLSALPVDELCRHFDGRFGRPSKDLHVVVGVLVLQQLQDLTDAQTVEALAFNLAWHYALDVRGESEAYLCEKTLRNYRRLLIENDLDEVLFRQLTDRLIGAFDVEVSHQRMDSTALRSAMRSLTRLGIVVETISKFVRDVEHRCPILYGAFDGEVIRRYVAREGAGCFANSAPSVSRRRLGEAGADLLALAVQFRGTAAAQLASFVILERVLTEQFEIPNDGDTDDGVLPAKDPKDVPCDNVGSPADPDSSYNAHHGQGYMAQITETYREDDDPEISSPAGSPDLITHVAVHKMTVHDGHRLPHALDDLKGRGLLPGILLTDSHYGSSDNLTLSQRHGVDLVAPARPPKGRASGRLTLEDFILDEDGLVECCPAGYRPVSVSAAHAKLQARFDPDICSRCNDKRRCPVPITKRTVADTRFQYTPARVAYRKRRLLEQTEGFLDRYRWRAGVEATMSRLKHQMRLAHLRVRGMERMRYVTFLRALGLNLHRCAAIGPLAQRK